MRLSSDCYEIQSVIKLYFRAAGTTTFISKTIVVYLERNFLELIIYNVYIEMYNSIYHLTTTHLNQVLQFN